MTYKLCLFDLDGTLTDPKVGITNAVHYSLASFGIDVSDKNELTKFIGPPLRASFRNFYSFSIEDAEIAVQKYREYYSKTGVFENTAYPGIDELLSTLYGNGILIALATSKPTVYAKQILEQFELEQYFTMVAGSELDGTRDTKGEVIGFVIEHLNQGRELSSVMVGDRMYDVIGASENNMPSIGVTYGYGSKEELKDAGAEIIVDSVQALQGVLTSL
jgi:phosphoglycolate phosphatase